MNNIEELRKKFGEEYQYPQDLYSKLQEIYNSEMNSTQTKKAPDGNQ
jgi:hypothetical protein